MSTWHHTFTYHKPSHIRSWTRFTASEHGSSSHESLRWPHASLSVSTPGLILDQHRVQQSSITRRLHDRLLRHETTITRDQRSSSHVLTHAGRARITITRSIETEIPTFLPEEAASTIRKYLVGSHDHTWINMSSCLKNSSTGGDVDRLDISNDFFNLQPFLATSLMYHYCQHSTFHQQ